MKDVQRVAKAMTVVRKPGTNRKWQACPMFSNSNTRTVSHQRFTDFFYANFRYPKQLENWPEVPETSRKKK